jgi:hypothetical protein
MKLWELIWVDELGFGKFIIPHKDSNTLCMPYLVQTGGATTFMSSYHYMKPCIGGCTWGIIQNNSQCMNNIKMLSAFIEKNFYKCDWCKQKLFTLVGVILCVVDFFCSIYFFFRISICIWFVLRLEHWGWHCTKP